VEADVWPAPMRTASHSTGHNMKLTALLVSTAIIGLASYALARFQQHIRSSPAQLPDRQDGRQEQMDEQEQDVDDKGKNGRQA